jgi:cyclic beta-1,2-glucan synthetase
MALQREIHTLRERHVTADGGSPDRPACTGFHVLRARRYSARRTGHPAATWRACTWMADGRPLAHHVQAWIQRHEDALEQRHRHVDHVGLAGPGTRAGRGGVDRGLRRPAGQLCLRGGQPVPPAAAVDQRAGQPGFGAQLSEAGGGYTWAVNSRLNQLTAWSNDPVADPPSEWFLLQDRRTRQAWSLAPSAWGAGRALPRQRTARATAR